MAYSKNNVVTHGLSGKVGDLLVFSQRAGKTIVKKTPQPSSKELTDKQKEHRLKFQQAIIYAKAAIADPAKKASYAAVAKPGESAFNVAVADLLNAPDIESVDMGSYTGKIGDKIIIRVTDDFKVAKVTVHISNNDGSLVEEGNAVADANNLDWIYTATADNASLTGDKVVIQAGDIPGNLTEKQQILS